MAIAAIANPDLFAGWQRQITSDTAAGGRASSGNGGAAISFPLTCYTRLLSA
jgi:hypothetical protein